MAVKPTAGQLAWQAAEFGLFCHFGINTFYGKEWSDGTLDPAGFEPVKLDARQWVETAQAVGARYLVFTAKHHDGFCLWPTETTDYSVAASPYKGDVVGELAQACRDLGMPLGLYLSPWDRHEPCYPDAEAYDRFYARQLTELCTRYGPLFEIWFDGAGSEGRVYNWEMIMALVDRHQPQAMVFNMGRKTIRWVGNEDGLAADPNYYVVRATEISAFTNQTEALAEGVYLPPECDVAIRRNWFWQPDDLHTLKSVEHLLGIYYRSVGLGGNLLLNVPPDRDGLIAAEDRARLLEWKAELNRRFADPIPAWLWQEGQTVWAEFERPATLDHLVLCEDLADGQHIDGHRIWAGDTCIAEGITVGYKRFHVFPAVTTNRVRIEVNTPAASLRSVTAYHAGHETLPEVQDRLDYGDWSAKVS
ncbi:MAG: alpha-L-fucosidase [Anaerolineae bacterium]|nr:alpha-L-fucosidase [Anaerolineae bacterium]